MSEKLHIKNMVCNRCIEAVEQELGKLEIPFINVSLGEVILTKPLDLDNNLKLGMVLKNRGFELLESKSSKLIEQIKNLVVSSIQNRKTVKTNYSTYIAESIGRDYSYLSNLFSSVEGRTIERYIIELKLEKVKELLIYDELDLSQIAYQLGYSSVQHLSNQFKKNTGMTPSEFRKGQSPNRRPLDGF
ncbi:MAG: helix-turn-helix domain-containing protein [Cyclobacteriaceae bacterium]